uniref:Predicted protein n=1 Tax=Physcomitrium patens TaxID=3218 RepID=A9U5P7_PHYPA
MVELFGLGMILEIRDDITSITDRYGNSWEDFLHALKDEYFLEDADRVTKKLLLEWIERPNKNLQATELLREFEREDLLQTNFGKGEMRALVQDYLKEHQTVVRESASYGARVDDEIGGSTETRKLPREALSRTAATIRGRTGWEDPVESLSVHAYIAKSQHEALMEEKRRGNFDDTREGNSFKRQTRGDKAREAASQELPLLSDIEAATNLKGVLEEPILNAKVEFTLKEVLGIAKKESHDVIIDSIKRKRQLMSETGMSHAIDARICRDEEEVDISYKQPTNEKNGYNQRVRFEDSSDKEMGTLSHYTRKHWARATTEVLVKQHGWKQKYLTMVLLMQGYGAKRDYRGTKEEVFSRDEGAFDASFIGILENGNIMYKKVDDFKRKERKTLYNIEGQLCKIENGLEDSLELITSIGLGDNDKIVEIHQESYLEYWEHQPTPVQILSGQVQSLRYSQPGHTEMLHSISITGVSRKRRTNSHDSLITENPSLTTGLSQSDARTNLTQLREHLGYYGHFPNIGPELVGRLNVVPIMGFDSVSGCPVLCTVSGNVVFGKWIS